MEKSYWLGRLRAATANARAASSAEARLIHLDLAGRYSMKADSIVRPDPAPVQARLPARGYADAAFYHRLETGARWLASRSTNDGERSEHLGMAFRYSRLRIEAQGDQG